MADKITKWRLVTGTASSQLSESVNKLISEGWKPSGNHQSVAYKYELGNVEFIFTQVMVQHEKEKSDG